jgi:hypothetical protein
MARSGVATLVLAHPQLRQLRTCQSPSDPAALSFAFGELPFDPLNRPMADAHLPRRLPDTVAFFQRSPDCGLERGSILARPSTLPAFRARCSSCRAGRSGFMLTAISPILVRSKALRFQMRHGKRMHDVEQDTVISHSITPNAFIPRSSTGRRGATMPHRCNSTKIAEFH